MKNNNLLVPIVVAIVVGVLAFYGGVKYQKSQATSGVNSAQYMQGKNAFGSRFRSGFRGQRIMGSATIGQIVSADANSITVKLKDGSTKIINIAASTKINKIESVTEKDLVTGQKVVVFGTVNSDGSITAKSVQLNPQARQGGLNASPSVTQ